MSARARSRGYTVVELMMGLAVFSAGVTGIITLQRTAVSANRMAKNVELAASIAQGWEAQLATDASMWRGTLNQTSSPWLSTLSDADMNGAWQLFAYDATRRYGACFDAFGQPTNAAADTYFCAHVRLTWLFTNDSDVTPTPGTANNGTIRTDVRVFWPREGATRIAGDSTDPGTIEDVAEATDRYYFVVQTGAVRQP